ncbi:MAG: VCBS repeat-containing protein [Byssovorax sp.]
MRTKGYGIALLGAAFGAFAALGCADLSQIQENTCGNGLVEVGEDCDSKATADGADCSADSSTCACRQHGELNECRFRCDQASDCPADGLGWGCGIDHVCRRPRVCKGTLCDRWESAALLPETASQVIIADFDGSGRGSLLSVASPLVSVHSFDESGRLLDSDVLVVPDANPAVGDLTSPDPSAPPDLFPTHDFVVDVSRGIEVFRGSTDSVMQPTIYASQALPVLGRAQSFSFLDDSLHAPAVLFFPQDADGKTSSIQGFESGSAIATLGTVPVAGKLAGDAVVAPFYNTLFPPFPCDQFAVTFEEAKGVRVYTPCKADGTLNEEGKPGYVQPALITLPIGSTIRKDAQGLFVVDADKDGTPDLLISVDDAIGGASSLCLAFSRGDGTFSSTPDKAVPADNKAALYPVHTALAQPEQVRKHLHDAPLAVGDINNDCAIDFVNQFGIYLSAIGKGSCFKPDTFFTLSVVEDEHVWTSAAVDDFSADGLLDVMVGSINTPGLTFYKGTGTNLLNPFKLVTQSGVKTFAVGDFDGDFVRDLAFTQSGEVDVDGSVHESIAVVYGGIAGGPTQPIVMGETSPIRQLLPTNVLGIYPDFITDLLGLATDHTGKGLELSLFPGNSGRLLQAPY